MRNLQFVTRNLQHVTSNLQHVIRNLQHVILCNLQREIGSAIVAMLLNVYLPLSRSDMELLQLSLV